MIHAKFPRPVRSRDPRKPQIVAALKRIAEAQRVTNVRELSAGLFAGQCLTYTRPCWNVKGIFQVTALECGIDLALERIVKKMQQEVGA